MFEHILVPLDGSATAEVVLPAAAYLAKTLNARVTLIHVIETDAAPSIHGERHLTSQQEAEAYLAQIAGRFFAAGRVDCHVHAAGTRDVARGIVLHEAELAPDMVILCTHGSSGLRGLLFGRIAQQVAAYGNLPVLLIRPEYPVDMAYTCRRILVPTDGTAKHAQGPAIAQHLACATGARLEILTVVPTHKALAGQQAIAGRFAPVATRVLLEMEATGRKEHLEEQTHTCQAAGVSAGTHLKRGEPAAVIAKMADKLEADLIVLGTHGKSGTQAFWNRSVGAGVLAKTLRPVLLVPVGAEQPGS